MNEPYIVCVFFPPRLQTWRPKWMPWGALHHPKLLLSPTSYLWPEEGVLSLHSDQGHIKSQQPICCTDRPVKKKLKAAIVKERLRRTPLLIPSQNAPPVITGILLLCVFLSTSLAINWNNNHLTCTPSVDFFPLSSSTVSFQVLIIIQQTLFKTNKQTKKGEKKKRF